MPHTQARPDETFIIDLARSFLRGDFSPPFYDYPWLYGWVLTGLYLVYYAWGRLFGVFHSIPDLLASWPVHWEPWFLIDRALSASAGTATVVVVFWIGRRIWDASTGLVAAFLLSVAFLHARDSHFGTTDVAMTMLVTLSAGLIVDAHLTRRRARFALAGLVGGLAAATKYNALLLAVPILASQVLHVIELPRNRWRAPLDSRLVLFGAGVRGGVRDRRAVRVPRSGTVPGRDGGVGGIDGHRHARSRPRQRMDAPSAILAALRARSSTAGGRPGGSGRTS